MTRIATWLALIVVGCSAETTSEQPSTQTLEILGVSAPTPLVEGSTLRVKARGVTSVDTVTLRVGSEAQPLLASLTQSGGSGSERRFELPRSLVTALGVGPTELRLTLLQTNATSAAFPFAAELADKLTVTLETITSGQVYREGQAIIGATGLLFGSEGSVEANLHGTFTPTGGAPAAATARLIVRPVEELDRTRGQVRLTTELGGAGPGQFVGTVQLRSVLKTGDESTSQVREVTWDFQPPALFRAAAAPVVLGQLVGLDGAGLIGAPDRPEEATILRLAGQVTDDAGTRAFGPAEVLAEHVSGEEVRLPLTFMIDEERLISTLFGISRGTFNGTITPVVIAGTEEVKGLSIPVDLTIRGVQQWVVVRFLPGFYDSLALFGLGLARTEVEAGIIERLRSIYAAWDIHFTVEAPQDVMPAALATLEIGGADPNGKGAFGYDNTPGKDVFNLRLDDHIGGENAETQEDGSAGFGGVFIDSLLWWSAHPELPGGRPDSAPDVDPLFDDIFDPTRAAPATLAEIHAQGDRSVVVARTIRALTSIIGETAAHEIGHSLGLADPHGKKTTYHNPEPAPGCLMDAGRHRPLVERAAEPGAAPTRLCHDGPAYLDKILPLP